MSEVNLNVNLSNCHSVGTLPASYAQGGQVDITLQADDNTEFKVEPYLSHLDDWGSTFKKKFTVSADKKTATVSYKLPKYNVSTLTLTAATLAVQNGVTLKANLSNCHSVGTLPASYVQGGQVDITLQADNKTEFKVDPYLSHLDNFGATFKKKFTVSADKNTATVSYKLPTDYNVGTLTITAETNPIQEIGSKFGAINVYIVNLDNLQEFSKKRFVKTTDATNYDFIDIGKYVNRIKRIYTPIESGSPDVLRCGNYNTEIQVFQPAADKITLDFGNVVVPAPNGDITDYESDIKIFIPFKGFVSMPNDYVGEQINLQIDINVLTGDGVVRLMHNGILFQVIEIRPSSDILYRTSTELTVIGSDNWNENIYYGTEPFIYFKYFTSKNNNGRNTDLKKGVISTFKGFNTFEDVTIISADNMLTDEQRAIYDALERGVYIN